MQVQLHIRVVDEAIVVESGCQRRRETGKRPGGEPIRLMGLIEARNWISIGGCAKFVICCFHPRRSLVQRPVTRIGSEGGRGREVSLVETSSSRWCTDSSMMEIHPA